MHKTQIIILAGGQGKRMESDLPKALTPLGGKTFIDYILESIKDISFGKEPIIVVGHKHEDVTKHVGPQKIYVHQQEQLGTGHAVAITESRIDPDTESIVVLFSDQPFLKKETIKKLIDVHTKNNPTTTMATTVVPDFDDWRNGFTNYSRVVRDANNKIIRTVENKDATEEERAIKEVNPCYLVFNKNWLFSEIKTLSKNNAQGEYYLTDLIRAAFEKGEPIETVSIQPIEALGANTKEQLAVLESLLNVD